MTSGFSSLFLLENNLTKNQIAKCFDILRNADFLIRNKEDRSFQSIGSDNPQGISTFLYNKTYAGISIAESEDFITLRIDKDKNDSPVISMLTNEMCKETGNLIFAYTDGEGDSPTGFQKTTTDTQIKWLFKQNYFGQTYLRKYGRDFFLKIPCVNREQISDDVIRLDLSNDIFSPIDTALKKEIDKYLSGFSLKVRYYNSKDHFFG